MDEATIILLVKLTLTPLLIALATLAGRRWGSAISGLMVGLPLTSGPVTFFIALTHSAPFVAATATAALLGTLANLVYCLTYAWVAQRLRWPLTLASSAIVFFVATFALQFVQLPLVVIFAVLIMGIIVARVLLPRAAAARITAATASPRWDLPLRMVLATGIVLLLSESASALGPRLTGLLTPFPLYVSILAAFAHHLHGPDDAVRVLRGLFGGLFAFAAFFMMIAIGIVPLGIGWTFAVSVVLALTIQFIALHVMRRGERAALAEVAGK